MSSDNQETECNQVKATVASSYKIKPADGKYGWVVAFGSFLSGVMLTVPLTVFPVIIFELTTMYDVNTATVSWLPSIHVTVNRLSGPLHAVIINAFGCRKSALIGSLAISTSLIASFFVNHIGILFFTFGALTGFGTGLCLTSNFVILSQYFRKYYGIAIGIFVASYPASRLALTPLTQYLLQEYGCRGVLLLMGAISMHGCIGAALFQPANWHSVLVSIDAEDSSADLEMKAVTRIELPGTYLTATSTTSTDQEFVANTSAAMAQKVETCLLDTSEIVTTKDTDKRHSMTRDSRRSEESKHFAEPHSKDIFSKIDLSLLKEPLFYLVSASEFLIHCLMVFSTIFVFPLGIEKGIAPLDVAFVISIKAIVEIGSRIGTPSLVLFLGVPNRYTFIGLGILHGILMVAAGTANINTLAVFFAWAMATGFALGGCVTLSGVLMTNTMGVQRLSSVLGLANLIQGIFFLPMGPSLGWLRDQSGSFTSIFTILALQQFLLVALWIAKPMIPIAKKA